MLVPGPIVTGDPLVVLASRSQDHGCAPIQAVGRTTHGDGRCRETGPGRCRARQGGNEPLTVGGIVSDGWISSSPERPRRGREDSQARQESVRPCAATVRRCREADPRRPTSGEEPAGLEGRHNAAAAKGEVIRLDLGLMLAGGIGERVAADLLWLDRWGSICGDRAKQKCEHSCCDRDRPNRCEVRASGAISDHDRQTSQPQNSRSRGQSWDPCWSGLLNTWTGIPACGGICGARRRSPYRCARDAARWCQHASRRRVAGAEESRPPPSGLQRDRGQCDRAGKSGHARRKLELRG